MIIIPDIHGRTFWKDAVAQATENELIIFLGDYLDPYNIEGISPKFAIANFKEIIEFKKTNLNNVILLLGNHDFMQYISKEMGSCRSDFENRDEISKIFSENRDLFKIALFKEINGKLYTFSHAGFEYGWANMVQQSLGVDTEDICEIICSLNAMWFENNPTLFKILNHVGPIRWGWSQFSSPIWADYREMNQFDWEYPNAFQIFGHTQQRKGPNITQFFACLDCRQAFRFENGEFIAITKENEL